MPSARSRGRRDAVEVGHRHVEDDDRGGRCATAASASRAVGGGGHGEALEAQRALEGLPDGGLVVDDEDKGITTGQRLP